MGVLLAAGVDRVPHNQKSEHPGQSGLNSNQDDTSDSLGGLRNAKFLDKDEDAGNREDANDLDGDVDDVTRLALKGTAPQQKAKHESLNDELGRGLGHAVAIASGKNATLGEQVDDDGDEDPPVVLLVGLVEETVLHPVVLVIVETADIALGLLQLASSAPNLVREEGEDTRKDT